MANVDVDYQAMYDAEGKLKAGQIDLEAVLTDLKKVVTNLVSSGFQTDAASVQFDTSYDEFNTGVKKTIEGLEGMAGYLKTAADTYKDVDEQLAKGLKG